MSHNMAGPEKLTPNMEVRDPNELNQHVKVQFEEVIAEPDGIRSLDCVWINGYKCFECGKSLAYRIITVLCGLWIALFWGCEFAVTSFLHVWCWTPLIRDFSVTMGCLKKIFVVIVDCSLVPVCEAFGVMFSGLRVAKP